ncbi:DUF1257 domain-containing protein [Microcoleus sp. bin38.metabat.b11b12b14.051]|uniref:DUF1257 domain-containing protein n=1 Tax=Microcoleus sp. bin38.metabat.b11b12b14.051 TaxID=2742709 RepID=UPI0025FAF500|nr:DUF1257 domain-containing protein [Microcoleus sp. bin38.metabat.b11b12b14.051]
MKLLQYLVYEGEETPPNNLPLVFEYVGQVYRWCDNPGVFVEENELKEILKSNKTGNPIEQIFECIEPPNLSEIDMSHLTHVKTQIKNPIVLEQVLNQMIANGLSGILTGASLDCNADIHDPFGNSKLAEFVIRRKQSYQGGYDFGFKLVEDKFEFLTRDGSKRDSQKFMEALLPWYARENAIAALIAQGFEIESQIEEDGTVKIVAGKWS